jgi:hypothetical protein
MADTDDDITRADDAIPTNAIRLTDAYNCVVNLVSNHAELLPKFDEDWSEALRKSREEEREIQDDPEAFDTIEQLTKFKLVLKAQSGHFAAES